MRSGRPRSAVTEEVIEKVREKLEENSKLSIRVGALELGMSNISYWRAVEEAGLRSFRPTKVQQLSEDDFVKRQEFCETMLALFDENTRLVDSHSLVRREQVHAARLCKPSQLLLLQLL